MSGPVLGAEELLTQDGPAQAGGRARAVLLLLLLTAALYAPTLSYDFVWDDEGLIEENSHIRFSRNIPSFFTSDYSRLSHQRIGLGFYRPLLALSFFVDYQFWGLNAAGFHLTNVLLHVLVTFLVCQLVLQLGGGPSVACLAALIFGIHPVHVEAVAFVSARVDLLYAAGYLLAALAFLKAGSSRGSRQRAWTLASLGGFAVGLLAKETAATLPLVLAVSPAGPASEGGRGWGRLRRLLPYLLVLAAYLLLRLLYTALPLGGSTGMQAQVVVARLLTAIRTLARYVLISVLPLAPVPYYEEGLLRSAADPTLLASAALLGAMAWASWWARSRAPLAAWGGLWFFLTLLPAANLVPIPGSREVQMADRYLYVPSVGVALAGAVLLERLVSRVAGRWRLAPARLQALALLLLLGLYVPFTLRWSEIWRDNEHLYEYMVRTSPASGDIYLNLASTYYNQGRYAEAKVAVERSLTLRPTGVGYAVLGTVYEALGRREEALGLFRRAHAAAPRDVRTSAYLGAALLSRGELEEATALLERVVRADPARAQAHTAVGVAYWRRREAEKAIAAFQRAQALAPEDPAPRYNLGLVYEEQRRDAEAAREFEAVLRLVPDSARARAKLDALRAPGRSARP